MVNRLPDLVDGEDLSIKDLLVSAEVEAAPRPATRCSPDKCRSHPFVLESRPIGPDCVAAVVAPPCRPSMGDLSCRVARLWVLCCPSVGDQSRRVARPSRYAACWRGTGGLGFVVGRVGILIERLLSKLPHPPLFFLLYGWEQGGGHCPRFFFFFLFFSL